MEPKALYYLLPVSTDEYYEEGDGRIIQLVEVMETEEGKMYSICGSAVEEMDENGFGAATEWSLGPTFYRRIVEEIPGLDSFDIMYIGNNSRTAYDRFLSHNFTWGVPVIDEEEEEEPIKEVEKPIDKGLVEEKIDIERPIDKGLINEKINAEKPIEEESMPESEVDTEPTEGPAEGN